MKHSFLALCMIIFSAPAMEKSVQHCLFNTVAYSLQKNYSISETFWAFYAWWEILTIHREENKEQHQRMLNNIFDCLRVNPENNSSFNDVRKNVFKAIRLTKKLYPTSSLKMDSINQQLQKEYNAFNNRKIRTKK